MTFDEKWKNRLSVLNNEAKQILGSFNKDLIQKHIRYSFYEINQTAAVDFILKGDIMTSKKKFSFQAMIAEYCFQVYNINWPTFLIRPYSAALLSDNAELIKRFAHLPVDKLIIKPDSSDKPAFWNYSIQGFLRNESQLINRGLEEMKSQIELKKDVTYTRAHLACVEAILEKDKNQIEKSLLLFEDKRLISKLFSVELCEQLILFSPIIYAKIAWLKGIEVEPKSKYMPVELLKIDPLPEYTIPYWFLRDFYHGQGVNWRYDPIYPELQKGL